MSNASMLAEMFSGLSPAERAERFESYKTALQTSIEDADSGRYTFSKVGRISKMRPSGTSVKSMEKMLEKVADIQKGLTGDAASQLQGDLDAAKAMIADLAKDWQVSVGGASANPSAEPVPYDLQRPIKELVPLHTPLRNHIPRNPQGEGLATHWKQLDSLNNSGVGTAGVLSPFFSSQVDTETFGALSLRRGKKISYVTSDKTAAYVEMGLSDLVTDVAQYAGAGFANVRQMSRHALTWSHLMGEERAILYGRGSSGNGYLGTVAAPVLTSATGTSTGGSIGAGTYYVKVTANTGFGESVVSNEVNTGALTGSTNKITVVVGTEPAGALNYNVYVGTATGTETLQGTFVGDTFDLTSYAAGGAAMPGSDTSFDANGYDGLLTNLSANGGYVKRINATLATGANVGSEFQDAFIAMYQNNFAEPDEIWLDANVKVELGQLLQNDAANLPFRIQLSQSAGTIGTAVTGIQSQLNSQMVPLEVHPFMPKGAVMIRSTRLPYPAQGITATSEIRTVQDYMAIDWPRIQHSFDSSTYFYGTMIHYAPAFSGLLLGVK